MPLKQPAQQVAHSRHTMLCMSPQISHVIFSEVLFKLFSSFPLSKHLETVFKTEYECLPIKLKVSRFAAHTWNVLAKT